MVLEVDVIRLCGPASLAASDKQMSNARLPPLPLPSFEDQVSVQPGTAASIQPLPAMRP
jgi:hypothetical protein